MKLSDNEVKDILTNKLEQHSPSVTFKKVWETHEKDAILKFSFKKILTIPMVAIIIIAALFSVGFATYQLNRTVDKTDYPFVNDAQVIGKWQCIDIVKTIEAFNPDQKAFRDDPFLKSLAFYKNGNILSAVNGGNSALADDIHTWTKGLIINTYEKTAGQYEINEINGATYMFFEWKSGDYGLRGMKPSFYVLKKVDNLDYSNYKVKAIETT